MIERRDDHAVRQRRPGRLIAIGVVVLGLQATTSGYTGCQDQQHNGTRYRGTGEKSVTFSGRTDTSGATITLHRLIDPNSVPDSTPSRWASRNVIGSTTPQTWNSSAPFYSWGPTTSVLRHGPGWPLGGVLRYRTTLASPTGPVELLAFDEDYAECQQEHADDSWGNIGIACRSQYPRPSVTHIVSTANNPIDAATTPPYLTRKLDLFASSNRGAGYYSRTQLDIPNVEATTEIPTLGVFKSRFDLGDGDDLGATYYNYGDLGLGREMHCGDWSDNGSSGVACYVTNYTGTAAAGDAFGAFAPGREQQALADAIARTRSIATVAMIYTTTGSVASAYPDRVEFLVFNGSGSFRADRNRSNEVLLSRAKLDNRTASGGDEIPSNCVTCHGGSASVAGEGNGRVSGAYFLPFDLQAFRYSNSNSTYSRANQEEAFRRLNAAVLRTNVPSRVRSLVNGWYAGDVTVAGRRFDDDFIPSGWRNTDDIPFAEKLYEQVFEPYCQGCHITQAADRFGFATAASFVAAKLYIATSVCGGSASLDGSTSSHADSHGEAARHAMPHAEKTMANFWNSGARAHLVAALDLRGACN